jgi:peroxiredoxin
MICLRYLFASILLPVFVATGLFMVPGSPAKSSAAFAGDLKPIRQGPQRLTPGDYRVGTMIPDLELTDINGQSFRLSSLRDRSAVVLAFTNTSCPLCLKYTPSLAALEQRFQNQNVEFVFINPTASERVDVIRNAIKASGFSGHYVLDESGSVARAVGATHTTDVFVLDAKRTLIYRGAVDDQYGFGYATDNPHRKFLIDAVESVLSGRQSVVAATVAPGCPLDLESADEPVSTATYHNRISRIIQSRCLSCHRDGGVAPFPLSSYEEVAGQSGAIRRVIEEEIMPPWFAAPAAEGTVSAFANDCSLAKSEKVALLDWLIHGKPEGDPEDAPLPRTFHGGWQIGEPDLIVQIPEPIAVKASGTMPYQNVIVETGLTETRYLKALEILPTARQVVHHVLVHVLPPAKGSSDAGDKAELDRDEGASGFFAAYAPGYDALVFNDGYGKVLPAGSRLKFQIHYTPNGTPTEDQSMLGMIFLNEAPDHLVDVVGIAQPRLAIPPGAANHEVVATQAVPKDATIIAFFPHMHLRGKAFRYEAILPDGEKQLLLDVPRYDFNWQLSYRLAEPLNLPAGSTLRATAVFDNSSENPANPDPTRTVRWGPQTYDEMMIGYVEYHMDKGSLGNRGRGAAAAVREQLGSGKGLELLFRRMDSNSDGRLTDDELPADQVDRLMRLDSDQDGAISLQEAKQLLRN